MGGRIELVLVEDGRINTGLEIRDKVLFFFLEHDILNN